MRIRNPAVTLEDEARCNVEEDVRCGFLDWLFTSVVTGDNGELYEVGGSILSLAKEQIDLVTFNLAKGKGFSRQLPNSIYRIGKFPGQLYKRRAKKPAGTLQVEKKEHSVIVTCGKDYRVECFENGVWHFNMDSGDGEFSCDLTHTAYGYPLWYGRETPSSLTQHSITYGYNWAGKVTGSFTYQGKTVRVKGSGQRERYVAVDSSSAELGGWEDWGYVTFREIHSSFYDMRLGMKDFSVYDLQTGKHYPEGKMSITHENWMFIRELDGFVPENYRIHIEVEDGIYEVMAHTCNVRTWGVTFKVPDMPVATLVFDRVEGTFTYHDGTKKVLTEGNGEMSIRQWHAYPNILPRELYSDEQKSGEKFETL